MKNVISHGEGEGNFHLNDNDAVITSSVNLTSILHAAFALSDPKSANMYTAKTISHFCAFGF